MPYIKLEQQAAIDANMKAVHCPGDLNYAITAICIDYMELKTPKTPIYATLNEIIGALECAKLEFYRRKLVPYEEEAMKRNGDVY